MKKRVLYAGAMMLAGTLLVTGCGKEPEENVDLKPQHTLEAIETVQETKEPITTVESQETITTMPEETITSTPKETITPTPEQMVTPTPEAKVDVMQIYSTVIRKYYDLICSGGDGTVEVVGEMGVIEAMGGLDTEEALNSIGYTIRDLSGDGIPELVIGEFSEADTGYGTMIYALYTLDNGEAKLVFDGWYRSCYRWMGENRFAYNGSGGAMYSIFGIAELTEDGKALQWKDYYFTHETDESFSEIGCYYNTTGEWEVSVSEKLDITLDELWELEEQLLKDKQWLEMKPMSE